MCTHQHKVKQRRMGSYTGFRHKWEMPLVCLSFMLTLLGFILGILVLFFNFKETSLGKIIQELISLDDVRLLAFLPLLALFIYIIRYYQIAKTRANAILVGPEQFPALFELYKHIGIKLEMTILPKLYVLNGNGVVNAFALECNKRQGYVVIHAEIAMLLSSHPAAVEFVLAHELAHHKLRHVSLWRNLIAFIPNILIIPGIITTRAQEYSADRLAFSVCEHYSSAMQLLSVGPWLQHQINPEAWLKQCSAEHKEFYIRCVNTVSSHAVMVKRYKALNDLEQRGFSVHGEMF